MSNSICNKPADTRKSGARPYLPLLIFVGLVVIRIPFLVTPIIGEDGLFAMMAVNNIRAPIPDANNPFLVAVADGRRIWGYPSHPIIPYWLLVHGLRPLTDGIDFDALSLNRKSMLARGQYLLLFLAALIVLYVMTAWLRKDLDNSMRIPALAVLAYIGASRPLLTGSIQPQLDGSYGVMQAAFVALLLYRANCAKGRAAAGTLVFCAGVIGSLGKQEWALALAGALLITQTLAWSRGLIVKDAPMTASPASTLLILAGIAGIVLGNAVSYYADPKNYMAGLYIITDRAQHGQSWLAITLHRLPRLYHLFLMLPLALAVLWRNRRRYLYHDLPLLAILLFALALIAGYMLNFSNPKTRYFCPGYFVLLTFIILGLRHTNLAPKWRRIIATGAVILCILDIGYSCTRIQTMAPGSKQRQKLERSLARTRDKNRIPLSSSRVPYYHPEVDYLNNSAYDNSPESLAKAREFYERCRRTGSSR